jgi:hypothetical protein
VTGAGARVGRDGEATVSGDPVRQRRWGIEGVDRLSLWRQGMRA